MLLDLVVPSSVGHIKYSNLTATGFTLNWALPSFNGNTPIIYYIIMILNHQNQSAAHYNCQRTSTVDLCTVNSSFVVIDGLYPYHRYLIKVWAVNKVGKSQSNNISITTDQSGKDLALLS